MNPTKTQMAIAKLQEQLRVAVEALESARGKLRYIFRQGELNHPGFNMVAKMNARDSIEKIDAALEKIKGKSLT